MSPKFSKKVIYDLKETQHRNNFDSENLLPCRNRREREQMTAFIDAVHEVLVDEMIEAFHRGPVYKTAKQANRALRFVSLERVGQLIELGRASKSSEIKPHQPEPKQSE